MLSLKERFISSLLSVDRRKETELKDKRKRVEDLEEFILSHLSSSLVHLVHATGEGLKFATVGEYSMIELSIASGGISALPFPFKQLHCQLRDPQAKLVKSSITLSQTGVCVVTYIPAVCGPHQLKIAIENMDIPGSPFTVYSLLPSEAKNFVPGGIRSLVQGTITGVNHPWDVAVSKSGEVVVSEWAGHCISLYTKEGKKIASFGSNGSSIGQFQYPRGIAITLDNHILIADCYNDRILMCTLEGLLVKSVGQSGNRPLQFGHPTGVAVHSSGKVFVADTDNNRVQVLHPDLSFSHMFDSCDSMPGQMGCPCGIACDSAGLVYVTDWYSHCVHLFSADGKFISSFGSKGFQYGQFYLPTGICVDSTNTVYVTDDNHRVSVYTSSGQLIKCFGTKGRGKDEFYYPRGVAVDNTTGLLYVCDRDNNRIVVY